MGLLFNKSRPSHSAAAKPHPAEGDRPRRRTADMPGDRIAYSSRIGHRRRIVASNPRMGVAARLLVLLMLLVACGVMFVAAAVLTRWLS